MQHRLIYLSNVVVLSLFAFVAHAGAQIIPDGSLGAENSRVVPNQEINGVESDRIDGGAIRGANLFHSFSEFNIGEGRGAYFSNPDGITNILTRVTGTNRSNILGTLGVLGNANLFLINPNGMIFGPNARLDLRGSFVGSSASGIVFDSFEFSTNNPQSPPLLTLNIPIGLRFRENPAAIVNRSQVPSLLPIPPSPIILPPNLGLEVVPGKTLALIGGDVSLENGSLYAESGNIILGSVASAGVVNFNLTPTNLIFDYQNIPNFGNIQMSGGASINVSGLGNGRVEIRGGNVNLSGARILALTLGNDNGRDINIWANSLLVGGGSQIYASTLGNGNGGNLNIQTKDNVELSGLGLDSYKEFVDRIVRTRTVELLEPNLVLITGTGIGTGKAGEIRIETRRLVMRDGATMGGATGWDGDGGTMTLRADTVEMVSSAIYNGTFKGSTGDGGDIVIEGASRLTLRNGALLLATTLGDGKSGNITINAKESIELIGISPSFPLNTGIGTSATVGTGKAGDVTINTGRLNISGGAAIDSSSGVILDQTVFSTSGGAGGNIKIKATESIEVEGLSEILGNERRNNSGISSITTTSSPGGNIIIETPNLIVRDGAVFSTVTVSSGDAGNITIDAQNIEVIGNGNNDESATRIEAASVNFGVVQPNDMGDAGSLTLNADRLIVRDVARINVQSLGGDGKAGRIDIVANAIALDTGGSINATTNSGGEGNIILNAQDIQLRRGSRITTDAGSSKGGNITINSDILLAFRGENSDITANAQTAKGGTVSINVGNIFGIAAISRDQIRENLQLTDTELEALPVNPTFWLQSNDIAAISQAAGANLQGTVTFSTSGINPASGLVELPQNIVDSATLIAANPCAEGQASEFVITGRGGLPANGGDRLIDDPVRVSWSELPAPQESRGTEKQGIRGELTDSSRERIVPAQGWEIDERGVVTLVAYNPGNSASVRHPNAQIICPPR